MLKSLLIFAFLVIGFLSNASSVIVGSEIHYQSTSTPQVYLVTAKIYRNCSEGELCSSCPSSGGSGCLLALQIVSAEGATIGTNYGTQSIPLKNNSGIIDAVQLCQDVKSICSNCGSRTPGTYTPGIEVYTFEGIINLSALPAGVCKVNIGLNTCCRNTGIFGSTTIGYYNYAQVNRCIALNNASPDFTNAPVIVTCAGQNYYYNMGAIDPDGDSLSYNFGTAYQAFNVSAPYTSPYSPTVPFPYLGAPIQSPPALPPTGISLDPITGYIMFRPMGSFVAYLVIDVTQWRKIGGVYTRIGVTRRDIELRSEICANNNPPIFKTYTEAGVLSSPQPLSDYTIRAGQSLCFTLSAWDGGTGSDTTDLSWNSPMNLVADGASFTKFYSDSLRKVIGLKLDSARFCWTPSAQMARSLPYYFIAKASDRQCPLGGKTSRNFTIKVTPPMAAIQCKKAYIGSNQQTILGAEINLNGSAAPILNSGILLATHTNLVKGAPNVKDSVLNATVLQFNMAFNQIQPQTKYYYRAYTQDAYGYIYSALDSFFWDYLPTQLIAADTLISFNTNSLSLSVQNVYSSYQWSNGAITKSTSVQQSGTYYVRVKLDSLHLALDSVKVFFIKGIAEKGSSACFKTSILLHTNATHTANVRWFNQATTDTLRIQLDSSMQVYCQYRLGSFFFADTVFFYLRSSPIPNHISAAKTLLCKASESTVLYADTGAYVYTWFKNNQLQELQTQAQFGNARYGSYRVLLTDANGCKGDTSEPINISLTNPLIAIINSPSNAYQCIQGNSFYFFDIGMGQIPRNTSWKILDSIYGTEALFFHRFTQAGNFKIKLIVSDTFGCIDSAHLMVYVHAMPQMPNLAALTPKKMCMQNQDTLTLQGLGTYNAYQWLKNGLPIAGANEDKYVVSSPGTYRLITNNFTCTDTSSSIQIAQASVVKAGISLQTDSILCQKNNKFLFTDSSSSASGISRRLWILGDGSTDTARSLAHSYSFAKTYTLKLFAENSEHCTDTAYQQIRVNPAIGNHFIYGSPFVVNVDSIYTYHALHADGVSVNWLVYNGTILSGQGTDSIRLKWNSPGSGDLRLALVNEFGCVDTTIIPFRVEIYPSTGLGSIQKNNAVQLFPNPNNGSFKLELQLKEANTYTCHIFNMQGELVYQKQVYSPGGKSSFEVESNLPPGMYFLKMGSDRDEFLLKFVIQ